MSNIIDNYKQKKLEEILTKQKDHISNCNDLTGGEDPSLLFYFLADKLGYLLDDDPDKVLSEKGMKIRRKINPIIKKIGPLFLANPQVIENRHSLMNPNEEEIPDTEISLPDEPVIWVANHHFKDDTLASILAAKRHAYILFGSVPQFYNTFDGLTAWANGVVMTNRKVASSRHSSVAKSVEVLEKGTDLFIFPEGVWNKSANSILIDLWPGVYRIAKETGVKVVPMAHYLRDTYHKKVPNNQIHTVVDDPIDITQMEEKEALKYLRDKLATWTYLMMEKYGKTTREELIGEETDSNIVWENNLKEHVKTADRYDLEIETTADYRPRSTVRPEDVWESISQITDVTPANVKDVEYAKKLVKEEKRRDFQRRF